MNRWTDGRKDGQRYSLKQKDKQTDRQAYSRCADGLQTNTQLNGHGRTDEQTGVEGWTDRQMNG